MTKDIWKDLGLTDLEISVMDVVNASSRVSQAAHRAGLELKEVDRGGAAAANTVTYRSALAKIHRAERRLSEGEY